MGKISPVSSKYIVQSTIFIDGIVDRPDVIGAIFGQTEGLLGSELELRELQRSGRIGRIEVNLDVKNGKTQGAIIIPSSLDKVETSIIAAALEIIERIGPCNAKIKIQKIEDVRITKRNFVVERAKELLKTMLEGIFPDSQEIAEEVAYSVRIMAATEYGRDRLPAGPSVEESDEVIVVEGRADVINLLKHGFKNVIALNGTSVPGTIVELSKRKILTAFVDGDRGGNLILKELFEVAELDYVTRAPDGKEVEEITKKEIHKALRSRIAAEQAKLELGVKTELRTEERSGKPKEEKPEVMGSVDSGAVRSSGFAREAKQEQRQERRPEFRPYVYQKPMFQRQPFRQDFRQDSRQEQRQEVKKEDNKIDDKTKEKFKKISEDLIGTRGAYILDEKINILGKVPVTELQTTLKSLTNVHAVIFDGPIDNELVKTAEKANVKFMIGMESNVSQKDSRISLLTISEL